MRCGAIGERGLIVFPVNEFQPDVNPDTSIVFFGRLFDVGVRVMKWYEKGGYDGYSTKKHVIREEDRKTGKMKVVKVIKGKRYGGRWPRPGRKLEAISQLMVHHTGGYLPGVCFNTLHNERRISVQFIIDDKGVIYQTMDAKEIAWQAGGQNRCSIGYELCLYPKAWSNPGAYRPSKCKRLGLAEHEVKVCYTQGKDRKVFMMPEAQVESLAFLLSGTWFARNCLLHGRAIAPPVFPRRPAGKGIDHDFAERHKQHEGLVIHANVTPKKWDATGVDLTKLEKRVATIYELQREGTLNVG